MEVSCRAQGLEELLYIGERALGAEVQVRDSGLLQSAVARPQATLVTLRQSREFTGSVTR